MGGAGGRDARVTATSQTLVGGDGNSGRGARLDGV